MCRSIGHVTAACLCSGHRQLVSSALWCLPQTRQSLIAPSHLHISSPTLMASWWLLGELSGIQIVQYKQLIAWANLQALIAHTQLLIEHAQRRTTSILCLTSGWWLCSIACDATLNWRSWMWLGHRHAIDLCDCHQISLQVHCQVHHKNPCQLKTWPISYWSVMMPIMDNSCTCHHKEFCNLADDFQIFFYTHCRLDRELNVIIRVPDLCISFWGWITKLLGSHST